MGDKKRLQDMTLEELWKLFPVVLTPHREEWGDQAAEEIDYLARLLADSHPVIHHIGSTAIPHIQAKPIVDILVETLSAGGWPEIKSLMESKGYICMSQSKERMSFNKGYTPEGYAEKVFHVHFHLAGDNDEILFRDYLRTHPDVAEEYERLKFSLLPEHKYNRDSYTAAKTSFINRIVSLAKES
ncbi:MAG: GrpB family protein [Paramuribaculum sp.]|nr:GrpB family protein [Paramuribaculum sp.]MDE6304537.1 GrpB family protein [Paramuribaculum sp.]